jgi:putative ABC transporter, ATP-binding protein
MSDLLSIIDLGSIDLRNVSKSLEQLELRVNKKVERLQRHLPYALKEYEELKQELRQIGVQSHNTYLYIQGHFLLDNIVLPLLKQVCAKLRTEREREIMRRAVHDVQYNNELSGYKHSVEDVQLLLKRHTGFMQSDIYQKINDDVRRILKI